MKNYIAAIIMWIKDNKDLAPLAAGILTSVTALIIALFGPWLTGLIIRPRLKVIYGEGNRCSRDTSSGGMPAINYLLEVKNTGSLASKNTVARIEKIVFNSPYNYRGEHELIYHPSMLHWSGTPYLTKADSPAFEPVDIYPRTSFFLDFIMVISSGEPDGMGGFNPPEQITNPSLMIWADPRPDRGIETRFNFEGKFEVHFHLAADNTKAKKYRAKVNWNKQSIRPQISISRRYR